MAIERTLRRLLERAVLPDTGTSAHTSTTNDDSARHSPLAPHESPRAILATLETACRQTTLLPLTGTSRDVHVAELLVLVAEAAIQQRDFDTAHHAVDWLLDDCTAKDQFYCRAQFVRAHCAAHAAATTTGATRVHSILNALRYVLLVLPVACDAHKRPAYDFLVYNASITYWRLARPLMKRATWQFLAPSLISIIDALRSVGERDVLWVAQLQLALVSALLDAKQLADAAKSVNDLVDNHLAPLVAAPASSDATSTSQTHQLYEAALRLQVHVGAMNDAECQKIMPLVKKSAVVASSIRASLLVKLQCVRSGNVGVTGVDVALCEIFQDATGFTAFSALSTSAADVAQFLQALDANALRAIDADVVVNLGLHAAFGQQRMIAHSCDTVLLHRRKTLTPRVRVLHQMLKVALQVSTPPTHNCHDDTVTRYSVVVARRVDAMKAIERALLAAKRQDDPALVERVCLYAWNLSLPLLQPHLRSCVNRVFVLATNVLEDADSLLLALRARLLLEVAKLDAASDFSSKAHANVRRALTLDYGASVVHAPTLSDVRLHERKFTTRPVDIHLLQLQQTLEYRLDIAPVDAGDANSAVHHIRALVEQARASKDTAAVRVALTQAAAALSAQVVKRTAPEVLVGLWTDACTLMHCKLQDAAMAEQFAVRGLETFFHSVTSASANDSVTSAYDLSSESPLRTEKSLMLRELELRALVVDLLAAHIKHRAAQLDAAKRQGDKSHASRRHKQRKDANAFEVAALQQLPSETLILGMHNAQAIDAAPSGATGDSNSSNNSNITSEDTTASSNAETVHDRMQAIDADALATKRALLEHVATSLAAATRIGWPFAIENTCVLLWNYHFHVFRALVAPASTFAVQSILPECIAAFEAAFAALETLADVDADLLASIALGLGAVYEKLARWDRVLAIADAMLKRKASSALGTSALAFAVATSPHAASVSAVHLLRFAELKTRAQLAQNAKEITVGETASLFLKVAALLEAFEASLSPAASPTTTAASNSSSSSASISDKSLAFYQKAVTLWQSIAAEMLTSASGRDALTLEDVQHQVEIYVELWTRIASAALRLQQFRFVIECTTHALAVLPRDDVAASTAAGRRKPSTLSGSLPLTTSSWRWLAASEVLGARAILALGSGDQTPKTLVLAALARLVHATAYAARAHAASLVVTASEVVWNAALMVLHSISSPETSKYGNKELQQLIDDLRTVLRALGGSCGASVVGDASSTNARRCYGNLVLLTLAVCEKTDAWSEASGVCDDALASETASALATETLSAIRTASAIASAKLGKVHTRGTAKPVVGSGCKTDTQSALLRAKINKKIAFSSVADPPAQLKALASAYAELEGQCEEQAVVLIDMAEWFYTTHIAPQEMDAHLDSALKRLLATELRTTAADDGASLHSPLTRSSTEFASAAASSEQLAASASTSSGLQTAADATLTYSPLWINEKLIRVFTMRAMAATTCSDRWQYMERALHCVQRAWVSVIAITNDVVLCDAFTKLANAADLDAAAWQRSQPLPYNTPQSSDQWLALYLQFAKSTDAQFYMEWVPRLQAAAQTASKPTTTLYITDPIVTCFYLEKLLEMLTDDNNMGDALALPTICLYHVVYHAYAPQHAHTTALWLDLVLSRVLERLHVAACALPMQSALERFQVHGHAIVQELHAEDTCTPRNVVIVSSTSNGGDGVRRPVLASTPMSLRRMMQRCVQRFVASGYVRHAKTALEILQRLAPTDDTATQSELAVLTALVLAAEGSAGAAAIKITRALQQPSYLDLHDLQQWTARFCDVASSRSARLVRLQATEKVLAHWLVSSPPLGQQAVGALDVLLWTAQLKFRRALLLLAVDADASSNDATNDDAEHVASSLQAFSECEQLLTHVGANVQLSACLVQFTQQLLHRKSSRNNSSDSHASYSTANVHTVAIAKRNFERAVEAMNEMRLRIQQFYDWTSGYSNSSNSNSRVPDAAAAEAAATLPHAATPLDWSIARAKLLRARIEIDAETSEAAVREHEMTWYAHESASQRNVVEKWLFETSHERTTTPGGDVGRAMSLSAAAHALLRRLDGIAPQLVANAAMHVLQCQRLALFHSADQHTAKSVHKRLWTRFTSTDAPEATWICGANNSSSSSSTNNAVASGMAAIACSDDEDAAAAAASNEAATARATLFLSDYVSQTQRILKTALDCRDVVLVRVCAFELVQVYGCEHPLKCIQSLLLFQSAVVHRDLDALVERCADSRDVQQLHRHRMAALQQTHAHATAHSLPFQLSQLFLEQSSAIAKRLSISVSSDVALAALPPHVRILLLQLSPDRCFLFGAVVSTSDRPYAIARIECTPTFQSLLTQLQARVAHWRLANASQLATLDEQHAQDANFDFVDAVAGCGPAASDDDLELAFSVIVSDTIELLAPLLRHTTFASVLQTEVPGAAVTLLVNRELASLPLEALPVLERAESVAREFSLHVLHQRMQSLRAMPLRRDDVRTLVDPFHDDVNKDPALTLNGVLQQYVKRSGAPFANWRDAVEHDQPPTSTDYQHALLTRRGGALVYVGANRVIGSALAAHELLAMGTALSCHVVCLLDRAENATSARRQSKADSDKAAWEIAIELDAYANAALWSLAGVNALVLNQWPTTFHANRHLANGLLGNLAKGFSLGKALKKHGELIVPTGAVAAPPSGANSAASSTASLPDGSHAVTLLTEAEVASSSSSNAAKIRRASVQLLQETAGGNRSIASVAAAAKGSGKQRLKHRVRFNTVVYGLAHVALKGAE